MKGNETRVPTRIRVPVDYPDLGVGTECDNDFRPFLALGDEERTIVSCQRPPGLHVGMDADCDCCACTSHRGPGWSSLFWNRNTPGALSAMQRVPVPEQDPT